MPKGELFLRTRKTKTATPVSGDGDEVTTRTTTAGEQAGWVDAWLRYGLSLEDGGRSQLMAPAPNKAAEGTSIAGVDGVAYMGSTIGVKDERQVQIDVHITARSEEEYLDRYYRLCREVLDCGYLQLRTRWEAGVTYHLLYRDCQTYREYGLGLAKMTLVLVEPHPEIRYDKEPGILRY